MAAAADAIASLVAGPGPESVVPDVFDDRLVATVAQAVGHSAHGLSDMTREEPGTEAVRDD
jgi:malic enzyme